MLTEGQRTDSKTCCLFPSLYNLVLVEAESMGSTERKFLLLGQLGSSSWRIMGPKEPFARILTGQRGVEKV